MKALVFDLDDTLLDSAKRIGPQTRLALDAWLAGGREIIFATSRPIRKVRAFIPAELFRRCEIITMNGAVQHSAGMQTYKAAGLGAAGRQLIERFPMGHEVHLTAELDGEIFATNYLSTDEELLQWNAATPDMIVPLETIDCNQIAKIALSRWGPHLSDLLPWLNGLGCELIMAEDGKFINVVARGVDKAPTLSRYFAGKGWSRADIAIFGDDLPDIKMMALTDHAVAMANAKPEVKAAAHHVIGHCDEDVIGQHMQRWL
ncbi:MAG: HAD-IIB family hydrolase [Opitutaceae bacterium]|nr:HAD-IIB family hydrolase [Opitutaceae bacterium]MBP9912870.1 HAD-IIB family hydrolase [Opitutaceae bacterium]